MKATQSYNTLQPIPVWNDSTLSKKPNTSKKGAWIGNPKKLEVEYSLASEKPRSKLVRNRPYSPFSLRRPVSMKLSKGGQSKELRKNNSSNTLAQSTEDVTDLRKTAVHNSKGTAENSPLLAHKTDQTKFFLDDEVAM